MATQPKVIGRSTIAAGKFLELQALEWRDGQGQARKWESAVRKGDQAAVVIIAVLKPSDHLLLIRQYRPPADGVVLEFPAGLIDGDETSAAAAARELREETGYVGVVTDVTDFAFSSPGMSSERVAFVTLEIDQSLPENAHPAATPDEGEEIEVLTVPRRELRAFCRDQVRDGVLLDSKVIAYALGGAMA